MRIMYIQKVYYIKAYAVRLFERLHTFPCAMYQVQGSFLVLIKIFG